MPHHLELIPVDSLSIVVVVDNEVDSLSAIPPNTVTVIADLHRLISSDKHVLADQDAHQAHFEEMCCGAHGLSLLITAKHADETHTILFDSGPDPAVLSRNGSRLSIDFASIDRLVLSHWHSDHSGGMLEAIRLCAKARKEQGQDVPVDVDVHPDYPEFRGIELKGKKVAWQKDPTVKQMEDAGAKVHQKDAPHLTCNEFFFVSGEIPRRTEYETGLPQIRWFPESKSWEPDPLIMDERFVIVNVKDKGMVLFTGCSHAGLVNVCLHAKELFPHLPLHAVIGGYHLAGRNESRIEATIKDLSNLDLTPHVFLPGHCTGWKARSALESAFPGKVVPIAAGNTVHIEAEHSGDEHLI